MSDIITCRYCGKKFGWEGGDPHRSHAVRHHEKACWTTMSQFEKGFYEGIQTFAIWKDGVERVGLMQTPLKEYFARWLAEHRFDPSE